MDAVSAAASILGIATAGIQISIKLIAFSNQVVTAPARIRNIGNDVSLTSGILKQIGDLMKAKVSDDGPTTIFSSEGLQKTKASAEVCNGIFHELKSALERASKQIHTNDGVLDGKRGLSKVERLKWPFLQPGFTDLRLDLRDSRETLMLILQVTTLAYSKKLAELNKPATLTLDEQSELISAIIAMEKPTSVSDINIVRQPKGVDERDESESSDSEDSRNSSSLEKKKHSNVDKATQASCLGSISIGGKSAKSGFEDCNESNPKSPQMPLGQSENAELTKNSDDVMEVWIVAPEIVTVFGGYNLRWEVDVLPLQQAEVANQLRRMQRWKRSNISEQLSALSKEEREAIDFHIAQSSKQVISQVSLLAVSFKKKRSLTKYRELSPRHSVIVIARRRYLRSQIEKSYLPTSRPTYIKVHRRYIDPKTLYAYKLPWEWDQRDPDFIIIKKWIPEEEQEILFQHTKSLIEPNPLALALPHHLSRRRDRHLLSRRKTPLLDEHLNDFIEITKDKTCPADDEDIAQSYGRIRLDNSPEATSQKTVDDLLVKYTTLYSDTGVKTTDSNH